MKPFRDQEHAALLRAAQLEDENAQLRQELEKIRTNTLDACHVGVGRTLIASAVSCALLGAGIALLASAAPHSGCLHSPVLVSRQAMLESSTGALPFTPQDCRLSVGRAYGWHNCRAVLTCAEGSAFGGLEDCVLDHGVPTSFADDAPSTQDGTPKLVVDLAKGTAELSDITADGTYRASFALE